MAEMLLMSSLRKSKEVPPSPVPDCLSSPCVASDFSPFPTLPSPPSPQYLMPPHNPLFSPCQQCPLLPLPALSPENLGNEPNVLARFSLSSSPDFPQCPSCSCSPLSPRSLSSPSN